MFSEWRNIYPENGRKFKTKKISRKVPTLLDGKSESINIIVHDQIITYSSLTKNYFSKEKKKAFMKRIRFIHYTRYFKRTFSSLDIKLVVYAYNIRL